MEIRAYAYSVPITPKPRRPEKYFQLCKLLRPAKVIYTDRLPCDLNHYFQAAGKFMINLNARAVLMTLVLFSLSGCAVGIKSSSVEDAPAQPEDTRLLTSVGFVLDDDVHKSPSQAFVASERESWIDALSSFTDQKNIFMMSGGKPVNIVKTRSPSQPAPDTAQILSGRLPIPSDNAAKAIDAFTEFEKTHPIVHVRVKSVSDDGDITAYDVLYSTPFVLSFVTFWITPAYITRPYMATFSLSMPEENKIPPAHWDYSFNRHEFYWLPLLPVADSSINLDRQVETDISWQIEEKRRLVLRFLADAKPLLQKINMPK
jgi:hypothetical protein